MNLDITHAERIVLIYAAKGFTTQETAAALFKGNDTVKTQRNKIMLKLGAKNMVDAVVKAMQRGIIELHTDAPSAQELYGLRKAA